MSRLTRRAALAAVGTALASGLAGCSGLNSSEASVEYDQSAIRALPGTLPQVPATIPVQPSEEHLAAARERVRSLLDGADVSAVPNAAVRHELARERDTARGALSQDRDGETPADALAGLTHPRSEAMFVHAGLAAFDGERTAGDVERRRERHHRDATAFLDDYRYAGPANEPVAALAEHATITDWARTGVRLTEQPERDEYENTVLHVAERAQGVEWGRAYAADARRLHERYVSTLDDPHDHGERFASVADTLVDDVEPHTATPDWDALGSDIERDLAGTAAEKLLEELASMRWSSAQYAVAQRDAGSFAGAIVAATRSLAADRAFADATAAITDGEYETPASIEPIAAERAAAVEGLRALLDTTPALLARRLARAVRSPVRLADENARAGGVTEPERSLYAEYAVANRLAATAPTVVERVGDAVTD
ncbi:hypothetical protein [Halolamina sp. C58]|uniref:hypothetical protein n=1 Tax=Halolamina sp. C58 TaxID=3421640 RepID=UPI003EB90801